MRLPQSTAAVLAAVCLTVPLAACGSSGTSSSDYRKQVKDIGQSFKAEVVSTQRQLGGATTDADRTKALDAFKGSFDKLAGRIDNLTPPDGAQAAQDRLVSVLHRGADDIGKVEAAVKAKDRTQATTAATSLQQDSADAQSALQTLKKKVE
jgi:hypothetical protein